MIGSANYPCRRGVQSRAAERYPAGSCRAPGLLCGAAHPRRAARRGSECRPQADQAGDAPARFRAHTPRRYRVSTTDSKHSLPVAANWLEQNFLAEKHDQVWLADITHIPTGEGWLYLAMILDLFTRKVVGWAMRQHMRAELTIAALTMAIQRRRPGPGLIHHSAANTPRAITARFCRPPPSPSR